MTKYWNSLNRWKRSFIPPLIIPETCRLIQDIASRTPLAFPRFLQKLCLDPNLDIRSRLRKRQCRRQACYALSDDCHACCHLEKEDLRHNVCKNRGTSREAISRTKLQVSGLIRGGIRLRFPRFREFQYFVIRVAVASRLKDRICQRGQKYHI